MPRLSNFGKCGIPKNAKKVVVLKDWVVYFKVI